MRLPSIGASITSSDKLLIPKVVIIEGYSSSPIGIKNRRFYLVDEEGIVTEPRTPPLRKLPLPDAGFRCRAEDDRSEGGSPRPWATGENTVAEVLDSRYQTGI